MRTHMCCAALALFVPTSSVMAQEVFDLGEVYRNAETIRLMQQQSRALELENEARERELSEQQGEPSQAQQSAHDVEVARRFDEAIKYRRYRWDDFDRVVFSDALVVTFDMVALMSESRYAADIAYYLGKHPEESARIAQMALADAGRAIFAIERQVIDSLE